MPGVQVLGIWSVLDRIDLQSPAHASFLNEGERQRVPERQVYRTRTVRFCSESDLRLTYIRLSTISMTTISSAMTGHELSSLTRYPGLSGMARQAPDL